MKPGLYQEEAQALWMALQVERMLREKTQLVPKGMVVLLAVLHGPRGNGFTVTTDSAEDPPDALVAETLRQMADRIAGPLKHPSDCACSECTMPDLHRP